MKGFDYSMKYATLVANKKLITCYFIPVLKLLLFTFIVDEIITI
jgi:hypothetical protein